MPVAGYPLFYHWHPAKPKGIGPMGWWFELWDGRTELVPSVTGKPVTTCVGKVPIDYPSPCPRCGWEARWVSI